ncbi:MAG: hydrogenase expression/formation protein HypE [Bacteroidales bacterium]|jgi:hydrogenase expression/formation protein HypE|nr:hydrogenase expression/formation protein HypE [Bacteroidales bacterium]
MKTVCPVPYNASDTILLGHGSGGRMSHQLIRDVFRAAFGNPLLDQDHDGCVFAVEAGRMAYSTDTFVVHPLFFKGGNIGDLAVNGTVNDLACCGAVPRYLATGFILEEGLPLTTLQAIVHSMQAAAGKAHVSIVTGDTKVVEHGKCDGIFINTSGVGIVPEGINIAPSRATVGDVVICSGNIGVHGVAIMSARDSLGFETALESDTTALNHITQQLLCTIADVHVLRDPTRGGVGTTLNEIAAAANVAIELDEAALPVPNAVKAASEILGIDPLYIANEGIMLVILPERHAEQALRLLQRFVESKNATTVGRVVASGRATVTLKTVYGNHRTVPMLAGEQLPRIC